MSGLWVFILRCVILLFALVRLVVLARLLTPKDFGLFGIVLLSAKTLETFSQTGFERALIHKNVDIEPYLDTAWTVQFLRGSALSIILFAIATPISHFFDEPGAGLLIRVLAISFMIDGLRSIKIVYFKKNLNFHKLFVFELSGTLVDLVATIAAAIIFRNAWALVYGMLAGCLARLLASYLIVPYQPRLSLNKKKRTELFSYGKWIFGSSITGFLITQGDDIFIGKFLGVAALGFYQMAYTISNLPATQITNVISQVSFPTYAKIQDNIPVLKETYLKTIQFTVFISFPIAGLIIPLAEDVVVLFLGKKWLPMVPAMQALVIWGVIRSVGACTGPLFQAVGRPDMVGKIQFLRLIILIIVIYPLTVQWGILGAAIAVSGTGLIMRPLTDYLVLEILKCRIWEYSKIFLLPFSSTLLTLALVALLKNQLFITETMISFVILAGSGMLVYISSVLVLDCILGGEIRANTSTFLRLVFQKKS